MSIHIHDVLDYMDEHPVCCHNGSVDSVLEMIHEAYIANNSIDSQRIRSLFQELRLNGEILTEECFDKLFSCVCELCYEHEMEAFSRGIVVGMHFMTEVNYLS